MAVIHIGKYTINKPVATPSFVISEVEVIGNDAFAVGHGILADLKVSLTLTSIDGKTIDVGYMVVNRHDRTLSYKGKFAMQKCSSLSEQLTRALACL